jgi:predicted metalloprotease with PDZ domain
MYSKKVNMILTKYRLRVTLCLAITATVLATTHANAAEDTVTYSLKITDAPHHLAQVAAKFPPTESASMDFIMPAWRLGKYKILNLANGIRNFTVTNTNGDILKAAKIDKNTWRVQLPRPTPVTVTYQLYANQLDTRARHIDDSHAYLDGASTFVYSPQFKDTPLTVDLDVPENWRSQSGMTRQSTHGFAAANYDTLASSPIESGIHEYYTFSADNRDYELVIWGIGNFNGQKIADDYKKMVIPHGQMYGDYPFKRYLFIIHATHGATGATEHINSTVIQRDAMSFGDPKQYQSFLGTSSHEFFHTWNVKAYRPVGIQRYDYTQENYSDLLWICEGSTSYFGDILLVRAGLLTAEDYLKSLAEKVQEYQQRPGRKVMSAQQSSFDAWIEDRGDRANNASVNIYSKGRLLSLLMDVQLLKATQAKNGYAHLHKLLYQRYPVDKKGFTALDVQNLMREISGANYSQFWREMIESTGPIDFETLFLNLGLEWARKKTDEEDPPPTVYSGIKLSGNAITSVPTDSPAWKAGLAAGDVLVALNNMKAEPNKLDLLLKAFQVGDEVKINYFRKYTLKETHLTLTPPPSRMTLKHVAQPSDLQKQMYQKWLGVDWPASPKKSEMETPQ